MQHCLRPADDICALRRALKPDAGLFIVNNLYRAVPTREQGWANDGVDIKEILIKEFTLQREGRLPSEIATESLSQLTYWASFLNQQFG